MLMFSLYLNSGLTPIKDFDVRKVTLAFFFLSVVSVPLTAQVCDPAVAPTGLTSTYIPGSGALLEWNAVPGSVGVQLRIDLPSGSVITRRIIGFERDQFAVPEALLSPGTYTFRVQAACSTVPPYSVTPISASNSFTVGGGGSCPATVTDVEGNVYNTIQIGSQCWMAENLMVTQYSNGAAIPTGLSNGAWSSASSGAYAVYNNSASFKPILGLLYNGYAVSDIRGLCPMGWHVPTDGEWTDLTDFLGGAFVAGGPMKTTGTVGAGTGLWEAPNTAASNTSGFSGLPGGFRGPTGSYGSRGNYGNFWAASDPSDGISYYRDLSFNSGTVNRNINGKVLGFSVRCLKD